MPVYNKLVRDLIPEIIKKDGKQCTTKILDNESYIIELKRKLHEELKEYENTTSNKDAVEELADILELIHALAKTHDTDFATIEKIRLKKAEERGGFHNRVYLVEVND